MTDIQSSANRKVFLQFRIALQFLRHEDYFVLMFGAFLPERTWPTVVIYVLSEDEMYMFLNMTRIIMSACPRPSYREGGLSLAIWSIYGHCRLKDKSRIVRPTTPHMPQYLHTALRWRSFE